MNYLIKRFAVGALLVLATISVSALPAKKVKRHVSQPDGTSIITILKGDENLHYLATADGLPLIKRASDGAYCYALYTGGTFSSTDIVAHEEGSRTEEEEAFISANKETTIKSLGEAQTKRMASRNAMREKRLPMHRTVSTRATAGTQVYEPYIGTYKGLVILVNFKDVKMQAKNTQAVFANQFNKEGYSQNGNNGSVHDYFKEQSYGQFNVTFDVVGPVTLPKNMAYYGKNNANDEDQHPEEMVYDALQLATKQYPNLDYSAYDWDNDGEIDQVYVIYAGYSESSGADSNTVWPHEYDIRGGGFEFTYQGLEFGTYGCSSELAGDGSEAAKTLDGIGTACHEFSHCLGLPDLYDTKGSNFGMSNWSVMDYGSYGGDGYQPTGYTSYERWVSGWLTPIPLTSAASVNNMQALTDVPEAYVVYNDANRSEYYLLENRQEKGSDIDLPGHGLLVLHVDFNKTAWDENVVNNTKTHQRCTIFHADNNDGSESIFDLMGDPYPGLSGNTSLTDKSRPAATLFNAAPDGRKYMGKPITNIAETNDGLISFDFMGGGDPVGIKEVSHAAGNNGLINVFSSEGKQLGTMTRAAFMQQTVKPGVYMLQHPDGTVDKVVR